MSAASPDPFAPVFLQSWWRTSSTYVWSKLRSLDHLCCYSEPLHEMVGGLTLPIVRGRVDTQAVANLHHPPMERPYFAEYEPLVRAGGAGFRKEFSYDRYLLYPNERDDDLERYLARLIGGARARGLRPVLACVRGSLRAAWMRRRFGGLHVALLRNPRDQWGSMLEQHRQGGTYFLSGVIAIAAKLHSRFPRTFAHIPYKLTNYVGPNYNPTELGRYLALAQEIDPDTGYALFALLWIASALHIVSVADIVLDSDRISADAEARAAAEARLAAHGLPVDFSDWATPRHPELSQSAERLGEIEAAAARSLATHARPLVMLNAQRLAQHTDALAPASAQLVALALDQLQRAGFFTRAAQGAT